MFDPSEAHGDVRFFRDIAEDARNECGKHGEVRGVVVDERSQGIRARRVRLRGSRRARQGGVTRAVVRGRLVTCHFEH